MKRNAIARIAIYSILIVVLLGLLLAGMELKNLRLDLGGDTGNYTAGNGSVDMSQIDHIEIEWVSGSVNVSIKPADSSEITFTEEGAAENCTMVYEVRGRTLILRYEKPALRIGAWKTPDKDLTVEVPASWRCESLDIEVVSADVDVLLLSASDVDVTSVSGKMKVYVAEAWDASLETVSGNATFLCDNANRIDCDTVSGNFEVFVSEAANEVDFESVSGDLKVCIFEELGFQASLDSLSGQVYPDFATSNSGGMYKYGDGQLEIKADSVSGDLYIKQMQIVLTGENCSHVWGPGQVQTIPGDTRQELVFTCLVCGSIKSEPVE